MENMTLEATIIYNELNNHKKRTKKQLIQALGSTNRIMRQHLEIVKQEYPVCNTQDGTGYYLARNEVEALDEFVRETKRARKILFNLRGLKKFIHKKTGKIPSVPKYITTTEKAVEEKETNETKVKSEKKKNSKKKNNKKKKAIKKATKKIDKKTTNNNKQKNIKVNTTKKKKSNASVKNKKKAGKKK